MMDIHSLIDKMTSDAAAGTLENGVSLRVFKNGDLMYNGQPFDTLMQLEDALGFSTPAAKHCGLHSWLDGGEASCPDCIALNQTAPLTVNSPEFAAVVGEATKPFEPLVLRANYRNVNDAEVKAYVTNIIDGVVEYDTHADDVPIRFGNKMSEVEFRINFPERFDLPEVSAQ